MKPQGTTCILHKMYTVPVHGAKLYSYNTFIYTYGMTKEYNTQHQ